jgi:hypothetical protein
MRQERFLGQGPRSLVTWNVSAAQMPFCSHYMLRFLGEGVRRRRGKREILPDCGKAVTPGTLVAAAGGGEVPEKA